LQSAPSTSRRQSTPTNLPKPSFSSPASTSSTCSRPTPRAARSARSAAPPSARPCCFRNRSTTSPRRMAATRRARAQERAPATAALQERMTATHKGSITSVQAIYVPADDLTEPAPATSFAHLDATTVLNRAISEKGIYPAVDPLDSTSRMLSPLVVGEEHYT